MVSERGGRHPGLAAGRSAVLGTLVNTRGLTELVVLSAGLQTGILDSRLYSPVVVMAVTTTAMTGPLLRWTTARAPAVFSTEPNPSLPGRPG